MNRTRRIDDANVVGIARRAGYRREIIVANTRKRTTSTPTEASGCLPERDHGAAGPRGDQPADQHAAEHRHHQHQIVVGRLLRNDNSNEPGTPSRSAGILLSAIGPFW
jgi:hypothetical protein